MSTFLWKNSRKNVFTVLLILFIGFIAITILFTLFDMHKKQSVKRFYLPDTLRLQAACLLAKDVYDFSGIVFRNIEDMSRSVYYPFTEDWSKCCHGGTFQIAAIETHDSIQWMGILIHESESKVLATATSAKQPPDALTRARMQILTTPHTAIEEKISKLRTNFIQKYRYSFQAGPCDVIFTPKTTNRDDSSSDLLNSDWKESELTHWMSAALGKDILTDGWGNRFMIKEKNEQSILISPGPDGRFGSADDLLVEF